MTPLFVSYPVALSQARSTTSQFTPLRSSFPGIVPRVVPSRRHLPPRDPEHPYLTRIVPKAVDTTTNYVVYVENESPYDVDFFIFQEPAEYIGGPTVYSNSLGTGVLAPTDPLLSSQLSFSIEVQFRAGVQKQLGMIEPGDIQVGKVTTALVKTRSNTSSEITRTDMSIDKNGMPDLRSTVDDNSVMKGAFRIVTPPYLPGLGPFNVGSATVVNGVNTLSNFITATPNQNVDVRPIVRFYIATGTYTVGQVVDFTQSSRGSAVCDATTGQTEFLVSYKQNGMFEVSKP